jgi:hypothetical protein
MSTTPASHAASTATPRAQAHPSRPAGGPNGAPGNSDLFSNLLALLSATHEAPALGATEFESDGEPPAKGLALGADATDQNPLAGLMGWPVASPQSLPPSGREGLPGNTSPTLRLQTTAAGEQGQADLPGNRSDTTPKAHPAPAQADANPQGVALQGMSLLETPVAPDASTLAALGRASGGEASTTAKAPASDAAPRPAAWRSTVGHTGHGHALTLPTVLSAGSDKLPGVVAGAVVPGMVAQARSTVALDERFGLASGNDAPLAGAGESAGTRPGAAAGGQPQGGGSGSPGTAPEHLGPDAVAERNEAPASETVFATHAQEAEDMVDAHWGMPSLRHASLQVGEAGDDAIHIQLAMTGQELNLEFRTDNSEARATLAQEASQSLGDLLERSGIQLGNVSVGAQSQQPDDPGRAPTQQATTSARGRAAGNSDHTATAAPVEPRLRSDGSRPLDLFV